MDADMEQFTEKLAIGENGIYRWSSQAETKDVRKQVKRAIWVCAAVLAAGLVFGACLDIRFMVTLLLPILAGTMALIIIVVLLSTRKQMHTVLRYEMSDNYIALTETDREVIYDFSGIKEIIIKEQYAELHGTGGKLTVHYPKEDFGFVKNYILTHTLGNAIVRYE